MDRREGDHFDCLSELVRRPSLSNHICPTLLLVLLAYLDLNAAA